MTGTVRNSRRAAKSSASRIRQSNSRIGKSISPVMQKVKSLLPANKAARTLAFLLDEPLSTCEKLLCGERAESASILIKLLCTEELGEAVLLTIGEGRGVKYIESVRRRVSLRSFKKNLADAQQLYAQALQAEVGQ